MIKFKTKFSNKYSIYSQHYFKICKKEGREVHKGNWTEKKKKKKGRKMPKMWLWYLLFFDKSNNHHYNKSKIKIKVFFFFFWNSKKKKETMKNSPSPRRDRRLQLRQKNGVVIYSELFVANSTSFFTITASQTSRNLIFSYFNSTHR